VFFSSVRSQSSITNLRKNEKCCFSHFISPFSNFSSWWLRLSRCLSSEERLPAQKPEAPILTLLDDGILGSAKIAISRLNGSHALKVPLRFSLSFASEGSFLVQRAFDLLHGVGDAVAVLDKLAHLLKGQETQTVGQFANVLQGQY